MDLPEIDIEFEELNFPEFVSDFITGERNGITLVKESINNNDDDEDDEDDAGDIDVFSHNFHDIGQQIYQIKKDYINVLYGGMKPYILHTRFKVTPPVLKIIDNSEGVEYLKFLSHYRGVICFGKLFDAKTQQNVIRKSLESLFDIVK